MCGALFVLNLDNIDTVLSEMGPQMRKSYLSCCFVAIAYFVFSQMVWKNAKNKRKEANVYRTNQQVYSIYELEEGEGKKEYKPRSTESSKASICGKKNDKVRNCSSQSETRGAKRQREANESSEERSGD